MYASTRAAAGLSGPNAGIAWLLGLGALVLGAATAAVLLRHPVRTSTVEPSPAPNAATEPARPPAPAQEVSAPEEGQAPTPALRPVRTAARPLARRGPSALESGRAFDDRLSSESRLLDLARTALAEGDLRRSLAALEQHRRTFPEGQMVPQREALRIEALIVSEDYPSALAAAGSFRHRFPQSLLKLKIDRLIRGLPEEWQEE